MNTGYKHKRLQPLHFTCLISSLLTQYTGYKHKRLQRPAFALYMLDIRPAQYATEEVKQIFLARKFSWKKSIIEIRLMFCMIKHCQRHNGAEG